jgi:hypothetical protein
MCTINTLSVVRQPGPSAGQLADACAQLAEARERGAGLAVELEAACEAARSYRG